MIFQEKAMHKNIHSTLIFGAAIVLVPIVNLIANIHLVEAKPVTYDFTVVVNQGSLSGKSFDGSFTYDDELLTGQGTEELDVKKGLSVNMNFLGKMYREIDDTSYPEYPKLIIQDGEIQTLDFWVEPIKRIIWWGLPGWNVEFSRRDDISQSSPAKKEKLEKGVSH